MDLSTTYMGFQLPHPLLPGASPMVDNLETVKPWRTPAHR